MFNPVPIPVAHGDGTGPEIIVNGDVGYTLSQGQ
jgi:hypothetical protein